MRYAQLILTLLALITPFTAYQDSTQSPDLKWKESLKKDVDEATSSYSKDPVSSLLGFKVVLEREKDGPNPEQKAWLQKQIAALQPKALATLQNDFDAAAEKLDLRNMSIAAVVANKIIKDGIKTEPKFTEAKNKVFSGAKGTGSVWRITNATAAFIEGEYVENDQFTKQPEISLKPNDGFQLLRVKAHVENTSSDSDKNYALWAIEDIQRVMTKNFTSPEIMSKPHRWLDDDFIFVLTPASDLLPCVHVCQGSELRGKLSMKVSKPGTTSGRMIFIPSPITENGGMDIDVLFNVPKGIREYRLFIFGSVPVQLNKPN